jgi:hypothetical protein
MRRRGLTHSLWLRASARITVGAWFLARRPSSPWGRCASSGAITVPRVKRAALLAVALSALPAASCGGGEETVSEDSLRDCLIEQGLTRSTGPAALASPNLGNVSPDFVASLPNGAGVSVVVEGSAESARRSAADIRGALQAFGLAAAGELVISARNAIAVFERPPSAQDRDAVSGCLKGT